MKVFINNSMRKQTCSNLHGNKMNKRKRKHTEGKRRKKYSLLSKRHLLVKTYLKRTKSALLSSHFNHVCWHLINAIVELWPSR